MTGYPVHLFVSSHLFVVAWIACGVGGALIQRRWYARKAIEQRTPGLDFAFNVVMGPIGLIASWVAYG